MADVKISGLPASTTPLAGTEVLPIVQSGATKQVSVANLTTGRAVTALNATVSDFVVGGGFVKFNNGANAASRSWRIVNDVSNFGDFAIQQSTTQTGGTYANIIYSTAGGIVGISSAPNLAYNAAFKLQVGADSGTNGIMIRGADSYLSFDNNVQALGSGRVYYNMASHYMALFTNNAEKVRIASSGGVSIGNTTDPGAGGLRASGLIYPQQATTAAAPAYVKGAIYFDTTLNKLRVGGATGWETITSA